MPFGLVEDHLVGDVGPGFDEIGPLPMEHRHRPRRDELHIDIALIEHAQMPLERLLNRWLGHCGAFGGGTQCDEIHRRGAEMRRRRDMAVNVDDFLPLVHGVPPFIALPRVSPRASSLARKGATPYAQIATNTNGSER